MSTEDRSAKCGTCEETFDLDTDYMQWANIAEEWLCESCYGSESQHVSTVLLYGPDYAGDGDGPDRVYVGDKFSMTKYGDDPEIEARRTWHSTSAWRGYNVTTIEGWTEVGLEGWTTGGWGDPTADRKRPFNEWVEGLKDEAPPVNVAVAADPTSNVFSTAITVYVQESDVETFDEWINGEKEVLHDALG
jgi:hypothetical protein